MTHVRRLGFNVPAGRAIIIIKPATADVEPAMVMAYAKA